MEEEGLYTQAFQTNFETQFLRGPFAAWLRSQQLVGRTCLNEAKHCSYLLHVGESVAMMIH